MRIMHAGEMTSGHNRGPLHHEANLPICASIHLSVQYSSPLLHTLTECCPNQVLIKLSSIPPQTLSLLLCIRILDALALIGLLRRQHSYSIWRQQHPQHNTSITIFRRLATECLLAPLLCGIHFHATTKTTVMRYTSGPL